MTMSGKYMQEIRALTESARARLEVDAYIERDPHRPGAAEARVIGYGVPVWALVSYISAAHGNLDQVAEDYALPIDAVIAAMLYYYDHMAVIDDRIRANTLATA